MNSPVSLFLPHYQTFTDALALMSLPLSSSELHGIMCGFLCAGHPEKGETYLRALAMQNKQKENRTSILALFDVYAISQQQITGMNFNFQMMLPDEDESLLIRAEAFREWCEGFTEGLTMAGVHYDHFQEEETQEALQHLTEFAELDCESLQINEEDERALMEVSEYTRMAVLKIYHDLQSECSEGQATAH